MKKIFLFFVCLIFFVSCSSEKENTQNNKMRIISVMPSYTEILFDLGAGDNIVGVSNYCDRPEAAKSITKVGDYYTPSAEKIYSLKPDVVFMPESTSFRLGKDLKNLNIHIVEIPQEKNISDIFGTIRILAKETGHEEDGENLVKKLKDMLPDVNPGQKRKKTYIDIDAGLWTCGNKSFLTDIVFISGGENVFAEIDKNYFQASWESIIKEEPEFILSISGNFSDIEKRPLSGKIPAIKNNAVLQLDRDIISRPSPSMFPLIRQIRQKLTETPSQD